MSARSPSAILFVCTSNSVRSPIAAALARRHLSGAIRIESAGVEARETDPFASAVIQELGLELSDSRPRPISVVDVASFDTIICLTPEAHREVLRLTAPSTAEVEFWPILDPTLERDLGRSRDQILAAYRAVRDEIEARIIARLGRSGSGNTPGRA